GQDGRRYIREGDQSRRQGRDEPDEFVLGHQGRDVSRSLRSSLDLERASYLKHARSLGRRAWTCWAYSAAGAAFFALAAALVAFWVDSRAALAAGDSIFSAIRADLPRRSRR